MSNIDARVAEVRGRIADAAARVGRSADEITLIGVSKTVSPDRVAEAIAAGVLCMGENRVQEAEPKIEQLGASAEWHLIGHLQRNKARRALSLFEWIHSVDSVQLLRRLDLQAAEEGTTARVLLQLNTAGRLQQHGVAPDRAQELAEVASTCRAVSVRGLMTIGPMTDDEVALRTAFTTARDVADTIRVQGFDGVSMDVLSMGMTSDFETAIEEGATMVRIGRAIFGTRDMGDAPA